jgi:two-component system CheB/CheR fusion protein
MIDLETNEDPQLGAANARRGVVKFPVVGIGASAGGIAALKLFFQGLPPDSGMAFVVIMHLSPEHESNLSAILQHHTEMPVSQIAGPTPVEANHVYVIPPNKHIAMSEGYIRLSSPDKAGERRAPIDLFFRSLAETQREQCACIILSGVGADGTIGMKRIKEMGGLTLAQDPENAEYDGMPRSAIQTGLVDYILAVDAMPERLLSFWEIAKKIALPVVEEQASPETLANELREILSVLRSLTGHNFINYKQATVLRRIQRRMQVAGTETLADYLAYIRAHHAEVYALLRDLLISVTNFFRDREAWDMLESAVMPHIFAGKHAGDQIRVWVPGCATGEEAYSIAMVLCERARKMQHPPKIQVFATDLDERAIASAREGLFPDTIEADVSAERLRSSFVKDQGRYQVKKELRESVLFATHDVLRDPPFSRLDLVSCRNLLIYLNKEAQQQLLTLFHFALRPEGHLFLGMSESTEVLPHLFSPEDKKHHIFSRRTVPRVSEVIPTLPSLDPDDKIPREGSVGVVAPRAQSLTELHQSLLEQYAPPSVVVNEQYEIVHLSNGVGRYLQMAGGEPSYNLGKVVHPDLRLELRNALFMAVQRGRSTETTRARVLLDGAERFIRLLVRPVTGPEPLRGYALVLFDEQDARAEGDEQASQSGSGISQLELEELQHFKEELRLTIEQYDTSTEELKASNEELQAMNEELRSTTEELETSKEELQAVNEELLTVNQELKSKVDELSRANSDLQNLMASTDIATLFLDRELRLKRFTPQVARLFNIIPSDINRPLSHLTHRLNYEKLIEDAEQVLRNLASTEREVQSTDGLWYMARFRPYRSGEDKIDGVVITFVDISELRASEEKLHDATTRTEAMITARTSDLSGLNKALRGEVRERRQAQETSRALTRRLVKAQEDERHNLSRELHDQLGQALTGLKLLLDTTAKGISGKDSERLVEARNIVDDLVHSVRELSLELRPAILDDMGLLPALLNLFESYTSQTSVQVEFRHKGLQNRLSPDLETTIYRVVQEALTNVARHSGTDHVTVEIIADGITIVRIEDHGEGFEPARSWRYATSGLSGMRERALLIGGELTVESAPGEGTRLIVEFPKEQSKSKTKSKKSRKSAKHDNNSDS